MVLYPKSYVLQHGWLHNVKPDVMANNQLKYWRMNTEQRDQLRRVWNQAAYGSGLWDYYCFGLDMACAAQREEVK